MRSCNNCQTKDLPRPLPEGRTFTSPRVYFSCSLTSDLIVAAISQLALWSQALQIISAISASLTVIQLLWRSCGLICSVVASHTKANSPTACLDLTLLNSIFSSQWLSYHLFTPLGANIQGKGINTKEVTQTWQTICDQYLTHVIETKWHHRPGYLSLRIK